MAKPKAVSRPPATAVRPGFVRSPALANIPLPPGDYGPGYQSAEKVLGVGYGDPEVHGPITTLQTVGDLSSARGTKMVAGAGNPMPQAGTDVFLLDPFEYLLSQYDSPDVAARLRRELLDEGWGSQWYGSPYLGFGRPSLITYARPTDTLSGNTRAVFLSHKTRPLASLMDVAASADPGQAARSMRHESIHAITDPVILRDGRPSSVPQAEVDAVAARQAPALVGVSPIKSRKELEALIQSGAPADEIMQRMERTQLEAAMRYHLAPAELLPHLSDVQHYHYKQTGGLLRDLDRSGLDAAVDAWANAPESASPITDQARQMYADAYHNSPGNTGLRDRMTSIMNTALQYGVPATLATAAAAAGSQASAAEPGQDSEAAAAMSAQEQYSAARRQIALDVQNKWDSLPENKDRIRRRAEELQAAGAHPSLALFAAAKEYELDRPVVSAEFVRDQLNPYYEGDQPVSLRYVINEAMMQRALGEAMREADGDQTPSPDGWSGTFDPSEAADAVVQYLTTGKQSQYDGLAKSAQGMVLGTLNAHAPQGEYSDKSGWSEEQYRGLEQRYGGERAPFMYPDAIQPNFDALRAYELFSADTENYEPHSWGSIGFGATAGIFTGDSSWAESLVRSKPVARANTAMEWYFKSQPRDYERTRTVNQPTGELTQRGQRWFRDPDTHDSRFYRYSATTPTGLVGVLGEDTSRLPARVSAYMLPYTQDTFSATADEKAALGEIRAHHKRPVPVVLKGLTPETMDEAGRMASGYEQASNDYFGGKYALATGVRPSPFTDMLLNVGRNSGDVWTVPDVAVSTATGGLAGAFGKQGLKASVAGAGKGAVKALGRNMAEEGIQGGLQSVPMQAAMGGGMGDYLFGEADNSLLKNEDGSDADPWNAPGEAAAAFDRNWQQQRDAMRKGVERYRSMRGTPQ